MNRDRSVNKALASIKEMVPFTLTELETGVIADHLTMIYTAGFESAFKKKKYSKSKPVVQLDIYGKYICEFPSCREAGTHYSINPANIRGVCNGKRHKAGGYSWMFKNDYDRLHG